MSTAPHQPLFVAGGIWAIVPVAVVAFGRGLPLPGSPFGDLVAWHAHEMVFGFAAAMFSGYALTAMRSWPGAPALPFGALAALVAFWALARMSAAGLLTSWTFLEMPAAVAFMGTVALFLGCAALRARSAKAALLALFALALTGVQFAVFRGSISPQIPVLALAVLLSTAGGRMVAAFTLSRSVGCPKQKRRCNAGQSIGVVSALSLLAAIVLATLDATGGLRNAALLIAATAETLRLFLWRSAATLGDTLLLMLHLGYSWLPLGLWLVALAGFPGALMQEAAALHALAAGAVACSMYAVASRAVARRAEVLRPKPIDMLAGVLLCSAAALRVFAPPGTEGLQAASILWCAAWSLFVLRHGKAALRPAFRPAFSGPRKARTGESTSLWQELKR